MSTKMGHNLKKGDTVIIDGAAYDLLAVSKMQDVRILHFAEGGSKMILRWDEIEVVG